MLRKISSYTTQLLYPRLSVLFREGRTVSAVNRARSDGKVRGGGPRLQQGGPYVDEG